MAVSRSFIPVWFEPSSLTSPITAGDQTINVDTTEYGDFRVGGLAVVWRDSFSYEVQEIQSLTATTITFTGLFVSDHPVTSVVYPVRIAHMQTRISGSRAPVNLQTTKVVFDVLDNDSDLADDSAFDTFNGRVLLDEPNMISGALAETMMRSLTIVDSLTGTFQVFSEEEVSRRGHSKRWFSNTRQRLWEVRQLLHALRGRQVSFYIPTFYDDFELTTPVLSTDDTITVRNFGYTTFVQGRAPRNVIQLVRNDGVKVIRTIIDSTELSADEERIQVNSNWGIDADLDEVVRIEYVTLVRLDNDVVVITHKNALGEAVVTAPLMEIIE